MRFYVDGLELDVQDPKFFIDEEQYLAYSESIEEMLSYTSSVYSTAHGHSANCECRESA